MRSLIDAREMDMNQLKASHKQQLDLFKIIYKEKGYREAEQIYQEKATR